MRVQGVFVVIAVSSGCFADPAEPDATGGSSSGAPGSTGTRPPTTSSTTDGGSESSSGTTGPGDTTTTGDSSDSADSSSSTGTPIDPWEPSPLWLTAVDGGAQSIGDRTDALWIDGDTIWVVGALARDSAGSQLSLHTLATNGELLDTFVYDDEERFTNARSITPSQSGMWIGGVINTDAGGTDRLLLEFDSTVGSFARADLWPELPGDDTIQTVQSNGAQLFLGGNVQSSADGDPQQWTARVLGDQLDWTRETGPTGAGVDSIRASVLLGAQNNVVFAGARADDARGTVGWVERLNTVGDEQWAVALPGDDWTNASAFAVATNPSGDLFVAGTASVAAQGLDAWVMRVGGNSGSVAWTTQLDNFGLDDVATGLAATDDAVFVCGSIRTDDAGRDAWIAKLDLAGELLGTVSFDGGLEDDDRIQTCVVHESTLVAVGSFYRPTGASRDGFVAAFPTE